MTMTRAAASRELDWRDKEANEFARNLLMPKHQMLREWKRSLRHINEHTAASDRLRWMAARFKVPEIQMARRLSELGLLT